MYHYDDWFVMFQLFCYSKNKKEVANKISGQQKGVEADNQQLFIMHISFPFFDVTLGHFIVNGFFSISKSKSLTAKIGK